MSLERHLLSDIWKAIAISCIHTHELRTVCNIAQDLSSLQQVCKCSRHRAADAWLQVADTLCDYVDGEFCNGMTAKDLRSNLPHSLLRSYSDQQLEQAIKLPPQKLAVYIQVQKDRFDRRNLIYRSKARKYRLCPKDLDALKGQAVPNPHRRSTLAIIYSKQDVIDAANKKFCGLEGFLQHDRTLREAANKRATTKRKKWEASDAGKAELKRRKEKFDKDAALAKSAPARRAALAASFAACGLHFSEHDLYGPVELYKDYLHRGVGEPDELAAEVFELQWLYDNTDIRKEMLRDGSSNYDSDEFWAPHVYDP